MGERGCGGCDCILAREAGGQVVGMCRCLPRSLDPEDRVRLRREVSAQRDELRALRAAVARVVAVPGDFAWRLHGSYGVQRDGAASFPGGITGPVRPVAALWAMGLALDAITPDAVVVVVPPVGGAS